MSGNILFGSCEVCGKEAILERTYYNYEIKCECHSPNHFECIDHCSNCTPIEPYITKIYMKSSNIKRLSASYLIIPFIIVMVGFGYLFLDYTKKMEREQKELKRFTDSIYRAYLEEKKPSK
jgi:hypothetical protein